MLRHLPYLLLVLACAGPSAQRGERLAASTRDFHDALRFRDYQNVATHLTEELRPDFLARAFGVEKALSVTEIDLLSMTLDASGEKAVTLSRISFFELPSTILHTENVRIDWVRKDGNWRIERVEGGPLPVPSP